MKLNINCQQIQTALGKIKGDVDLGLTLDLAATKPADIIKLATRDAAKISRLLDRHPQELTQCVAKFAAGDLEKANSILQEIGGTEEDFLKSRGGAAGLAILLFVVVMLYACPAKGKK